MRLYPSDEAKTLIWTTKDASNRLDISQKSGIISVLRDHLMVGCDSLKVVILVRIQVPQQF